MNLSLSLYILHTHTIYTISYCHIIPYPKSSASAYAQVSSVCPYRCDEDREDDEDRSDASCFALSAERCRAARAAYRRCLGW